jgi:hypothetical protein
MKKFFAIIIFLFCVFPAFSCALLTLATNTWILDRQFYIGLVSDERFYDVILQPDLLPADLQTVLESNEIPTTAVTTALKEVVTPAYIRDQAVGAVNTLFDVFDGKTEQLIFTIDTKPVKKALEGEDGDKFAVAFAEALPTCATGESQFAGDELIMRCLPEGKSAESAVSDIREGLPKLLDKVPDTLSYDASAAMQQAMRSSRSRSTNITVTPEQLMAAIADNSLNTFASSLLVFGILFLLVGMLLWSDSWRGRLQYVGVSLALSAVVVLLLGFSIAGSAAVTSSALMGGTITVNGAPASPEMRQAMSAVITPALSRVGNSYSSTAAVAVGVGVVIFIVGLVLPRRQSDDLYFENESFKRKNE